MEFRYRVWKVAHIANCVKFTKNQLYATLLEETHFLNCLPLYYKKDHQEFVMHTGVRQLKLCTTPQVYSLRVANVWPQ